MRAVGDVSRTTRLVLIPDWAAETEFGSMSAPAPAGNVGASDKQWLLAKDIRDPDSDLLSASARMNDQAQRLIAIRLERPKGCCGAVAHVPIQC